MRLVVNLVSADLNLRNTDLLPNSTNVFIRAARRQNSDDCLRL